MADDREKAPNPDEPVDEIGRASNEDVTASDEEEFEDEDTGDVDDSDEATGSE